MKNKDDNVVGVSVLKYVPEILFPECNGYGDYLIMKIDKDGFINKWKPELINKLLFGAEK
ncbi:MAG: hypothetical protein LBD84_07645 [Campylobacteraceae bacterium]|nr:hypothetical protein [Campylobacteraceae bacterium]